MTAYAKRVLLHLLLLSFLLSSCAFAQTETQAPEHVYSQAELDQMLAPIALYPDSLLSQILIAATYPLEIVEAARWSRANPQLHGQDAVKAVDDRNWDPSVKSLVAFPRVLQRMDEKLEWTEQLGDAFLAQESQVMDTVQRLRKRAYEAGNLRSSDQQRVLKQDDTIIVEPANPAVVYVPYYDPVAVYGSWWWPAYPPVYWAPWPGYYASPGYVGPIWGGGVIIGANFFFGVSDWHRRHIRIVDAHPFYYHRPGQRPIPDKVWRHDPYHRRGVPYRHPSVRERYHPITAPEVRRAYRGYPPPPQNHPVPTPRPDTPPRGGRPPGEHRAPPPAPAPGTPLPSPGDIRKFPRTAPPAPPSPGAAPPHIGRFPHNVPPPTPAPGTPMPPAGSIGKLPRAVPQLPSSPGATPPQAVPAPGTPLPPAMRKIPNAPIARPTPEPRPNALEGVGRGLDVHSERGHASAQRPPPVNIPRPVQPAPRGAVPPASGGNFPGTFGWQRGGGR